MGIREQTLCGIKRICWTVIMGYLISGIGFPVVIVSGQVCMVGDNVDGVFRHTAVASEAAICSQIGSDIMLLDGGSAVDAAIAAQICEGVVNPHTSGIGGGFVMTMYDSATDTSQALIASEKAPGGATEDMFAAGTGVSSTTGGMAVAVPGAIEGFWEMHQQHGEVPWADLFQPSIDLAREGIPIGEHLAGVISLFEDQFDEYPALNEMFFDVDTGAAKVEGDTFTQPKLADTLEAIAAGNSDTFYAGSLTPDVVADIADAGGIITVTDLGDYTAEPTTPVTLDISDGMTVHTVPPPGSGVVTEYLLNIVEGFGFTPSDLSTTEDAVLTLHRIIEAMKFAFAELPYLGDPDFVDVTGLIANMTSPAFGDAIRGLIGETASVNEEYCGPSFFGPDRSATSHVSVLDKNGSAVSISSSLNTWFGAKVFGDRTGIIFNNQMGAFSSPNVTNVYGIEAPPANFIAPGKRPMSGMSPSVVNGADGKVKLVVGASGGRQMITATALVILGILKFDKDVGVAVNISRFHHEVFPKEVTVEDTIAEAIILGLMEKGHGVVPETPGRSFVQAIHKEGEFIKATSDWRKDGRPYGY